MVRADGDVGVEQEIGSPFVRHPARVEKDVLSRQPEPGREGLELRGHRHLGDGGVGVAKPQEHQAYVRHLVAQPVHRPQDRDGVKPVVHSPTPEHHLVEWADPGKRAAQAVGLATWRFARQAVGHDRNELF